MYLKYIMSMCLDLIGTGGYCEESNKPSDCMKYEKVHEAERLLTLQQTLRKFLQARRWNFGHHKRQAFLNSRAVFQKELCLMQLTQIKKVMSIGERCTD